MTELVDTEQLLSADGALRRTEILEDDLSVSGTLDESIDVSDFSDEVVIIEIELEADEGGSTEVALRVNDDGSSS